MTSPSGQAKAGRPQKSDPALSRSAILDAAMELYREGGLTAVTFRAIAQRTNFTAMAVTYHAGTKKDLLAQLVDAAFRNTLEDSPEMPAKARLRGMLARYCQRAIEHGDLLRAVLADTTLMGPELRRITDALDQEIPRSEKGEPVLLHLVIDYTHGFVLSATASEDNPLTLDDYLVGLDWILDRM